MLLNSLMSWTTNGSRTKKEILLKTIENCYNFIIPIGTNFLDIPQPYIDMEFLLFLTMYFIYMIMTTNHSN